MAVNHGLGVRVAAPEGPVTLGNGDRLVAVDDNQVTAGQRDPSLTGQMLEDMAFVCRPFLGHVVVAPNGDHLLARLERQQDVRPTDVAGVHRHVAIGHQIRDPWIEKAMCVSQQCYAHHIGFFSASCNQS